MRKPTFKQIVIATAISGFIFLVALSMLVPTMMAPHPGAVFNAAEQELNLLYDSIAEYRAHHDEKFPESLYELEKETSFLNGRTEESRSFIFENFQYPVQSEVGAGFQEVIARYTIEGFEFSLLLDGTVLRTNE